MSGQRPLRSPVPPDTIVAIATPLGEGGLGVIRLSGPDALLIASRLFRTNKPLNEVSTHTLHHGWIQDHAHTVDEAVAAVFRAPQSFTGENVVEFSCHGSPAVLKEVIRLCEVAGARQAQPGEFTLRAFLNGKIDLLQAEAVAELVRARSERARGAAAAQLRGILSARIAALRTRLIDLLARVEANLDFVEEDIPGLPRRDLADGVRSIRNDIEDLLATSVRGRRIREGVRLVLAGKPNVGKSSLFNALLAADRAIVTDTPGTTRDTLEEQLEWDGLSVVLVDTAGLRPTQDAVEALGAERARRAQAEAHLVLVVVDGSAPLEAADRDLLGSIHGPRLVVLNKMDRGLTVSASSLSERSVAVSAKTGDGLPALKEAVMSLVDGAGEIEDAAVVTNARHVRALETARDRLTAAAAAAEREASEEAIASDLRAAAEAVGAITGEGVADDVLASIFRQFCIGK